MELSLIQKDKLKVLLTPLDMARYDLTCEMLDYDNTETRRAMWSILDHAKHETGFDAAVGKIYIEVYPEKDGGCKIYITKLQKNELPPTGDMNGISEKMPATLPKEVRAVYRFDDTENLAQVCKFLARRGYRAPSEAFVEELPRRKRRYYLLISEAMPVTGKRAKFLRENLILGEFGTRLDGDFSVSYLHEHCERLCEKDAVHILAPLAK